ncbi:MAG: hypothetical protein IKC08_08730 [Lentisphaeria bacterium]|jgi:hypothetical protein|nr:hypothetical protein [Lentisphaeria bacterium]
MQIESFNQVLGLAIQILFSAVGLWCGIKITKNKVDFTGTLIISFVAVLAGMQPEPWGLILTMLSMFLMLWKFGSAKIFPDCLVVVLLSWGVGFAGKFLIKYVAENMR